MRLSDSRDYLVLTLCWTCPDLLKPEIPISAQHPDADALDQQSAIELSEACDQNKLHSQRRSLSTSCPAPQGARSSLQEGSLQLPNENHVHDMYYMQVRAASTSRTSSRPTISAPQWVILFNDKPATAASHVIVLQARWRRSANPES